MTELVLASNNRKKIAELETFFLSASSNIMRVRTLSEIGWTREIAEDGESFEENSLIKASVPASLGYVGVADDSGLSVDALGGAPGVFSARYSGEGATDARNRAKLLKALADVPEEKRTARFVCVMTLVLPEDSPCVIPLEWRPDERLTWKRGIDPARVMSVRGECEGMITRERRGSGGFGYDPLFYYPPLEATFGELPAEEKNKISHRANAMKKLAEEIKKII